MTLTYLNEDDKAYGLAGMAISLAALDAMDRVSCISLDSDGPMVNFSHAYYFSGSPLISPKTTWDNLLHNYYITSAMILSNVMSRSFVRMRQDIPSELLNELHDAIAEEGRETCSLDEDEIDSIFNKTKTQMGRIFRNPRLHPAITDFAGTISRRRSLSGREIIDELRAVSLL